MSPRFLGCAAVIVRSFARIHESNLKKQGVLPLTFANPADYDRVQATDKVSLVGLKDLAPGREVTARLHHAGGAPEEIRLRHTLSAEQIGWFRAGSALNLLRERYRG
jgi:aconitate hydratase